jgi:hypothetical protein
VGDPALPSIPRAPGDEEPTDLEPTDPEPTDPEPTDPEPTDPEPTDVTGAVRGLCSPCRYGTECGDSNDYCPTFPSGEKFCTRDCSEARCPEGYRCVDISNTSTDQCVPEDGSCDHRSGIEPPPSTAQVRATVLAEVNRYRAASSLPPLAADDCLNEIALASARELASSGQRSTKYRRECASLASCACGWSSENQYQGAGYGLEWRQSLLEAVDLAFGEADSANRIASTRVARLGVGVVFGGDEIWLSFTYAS